MCSTGGQHLHSLNIAIAIIAKEFDVHVDVDVDVDGVARESMHAATSSAENGRRNDETDIAPFS